jgi:hypothetical protein
VKFDLPNYTFLIKNITKSKITMKKLLTIITFCITAMTVNAQTISGIVVDETSVPIESVNVVLNTADSVFIEGTTTNKSGEFILQKGDDSIKRLIFSYTGYQTKTINVTQGNVGKIIILSDTLTLKEAVVIGSNITFKDGKRIIRPTAEQIEKSPTGFILLDNLDLPRLDVDIVKKSISVMGGGGVVMLINGREADNIEIIGLDPKTIINIEYSDMPSARFSGASVILNFIVKQVEKGGMLAADLTNGLTVVYGEDSFFAKFYNGASQFSIWYMPQFRDFKSQWRDNEETFYLNNSTIQRKEFGIPARLRYLVQNFNFSYNYFKDDRIFDVSLSSEIENYPDDNFKSKLVTNTSVDTLFMIDNSRNTAFTPRLRLYYQEPLGENQMLYASLSGGYAKRNYKRDYQELLNDNTVESYFYSDVDERQQAYTATVSYENMIDLGKSGWKFEFSGDLKHNYIRSKNIYNNNVQNINSEIYSNRSTLAAHAGLISKKLRLYANFSLYRNNHSVDTIKINKYNVSSALTGIYRFDEKSCIYSYAMFAYNSFPSLSYLSNVDQFIDSLQIRRGNPFIQIPKYYYGRILYEFSAKKIEMVFQIEYRYTSKPVMESSFVENDYIIRTVENHKNFQKLSPFVAFRVKKLWNFLSVYVQGTLDRYFSYGNTYTQKKSIFKLYSRVDLYYKKWRLQYSFHHKTDDVFFGETLTLQEGGDRITLYYTQPTFQIGIGCFDPFKSTYSGAIVNNSNVAPYRKYDYVNDLRNRRGFFFKLVKIFKWGQQKEDVNINANDEKAESAILKGQK